LQHLTGMNPTPYAYIPPGASPPHSEAQPSTTSASQQSYMHHSSNPSGSSGNYTGSLQNVGLYPTPVPSEGSAPGSVRSRKQEQERRMSAALPTPAEAPLVPQRRSQRRPVIERHTDSGVRLTLPPSPTSELGFMDLPPGYTAD
jgi:hypothetical protein